MNFSQRYCQRCEDSVPYLITRLVPPAVAVYNQYIEICLKCDIYKDKFFTNKDELIYSLFEKRNHGLEVRSKGVGE